MSNLFGLGEDFGSGVGVARVPYTGGESFPRKAGCLGDTPRFVKKMRKGFRPWFVEDDECLPLFQVLLLTTLF